MRKVILILGCLGAMASDAGAQTWSLLAPSGPAPSARAYHAMAYDAANDRAIIFGGASNCTPLNDVWVLTHASGQTGTPAWVQLAPTGPAPDGRYGTSAAYDAANNRLIVFGGAAGSNCSGAPPLRNDVWI